MNPSQIKEQSKQLIDQALAAGAEQCDVLFLTGKSFSVSVQDAALDKYKVSSSSVIGLRVVKDQKVGISYSEALDQDSVKRVVKQALTNASYTDKTPFQQIDVKNDEDIIVDDKSLCQDDSSSVEDKIDFALSLEKETLARDSRVSGVPYNGLGESEGAYAYSNHLGTFCYHHEKSVSCYVAALTKDQDRQAMYGHSMVGRKLADLDKDACIEGALQYALPLLDAKPIKTGRYDVIFDIDQLEQLIGVFSSIFSAKQVLEGRSRLGGKISEIIASDLLTLKDIPQHPQGFSYSLFDDEGRRRSELTLIENGVLKSFLHNSATAREMDVAPTAHASRGAKSPLGISATQLMIEPGKSSELSVKGGKYLYIVALKGLHSGTNAISGHFSLAVEGLLMNDSGKVEQYVKDVTVSGNAFELLKQIEAVGDTTHSSHSKTFFAPIIRFGGLSVAGN